MDFNIKRLFIDDFHYLNKLYDREIYISSYTSYLINKFLTCISQKLYTLKVNAIYIYDDFNTDYINSIILPDYRTSIKGSKYINSKYDLNSIIKNNNKLWYAEEDNKYIKEDLLSIRDKIYNIFKTISSTFIKKIPYINTLNSFKDKFILNIFNQIPSKGIDNNLEFLISSAGVNGFKTLSNNLPMYENRVFVINDSFDSFKNVLFNEIICKLNKLNLHYEIYKSPIDKVNIDHIKVPSLDLCIISNNILFKEKIPGVQINLDMFINYSNYTEINSLKEQLHNITLKYDYLSNILRKYREEYSTLLDRNIIRNRFYELIEDIIKNVIQ